MEGGGGFLIPLRCTKLVLGGGKPPRPPPPPGAVPVPYSDYFEDVKFVHLTAENATCRRACKNRLVILEMKMEMHRSAGHTRPLGGGMNSPTLIERNIHQFSNVRPELTPTKKGGEVVLKGGLSGPHCHGGHPQSGAGMVRCFYHSALFDILGSVALHPSILRIHPSSTFIFQIRISFVCRGGGAASAPSARLPDFDGFSPLCAFASKIASE